MPIQEPLIIYQELFSKDANYSTRYAKALHCNATCMKKSKNLVQSLEIIQSCVSTYEFSPQQDTIHFKSKLVWHLKLYIDLLVNLVKPAEAVVVYEKIILIYKELVVIDFKCSGEKYASFLEEYANFLDHNAWLEYEGPYWDSPNLMKANRLYLESIELREKLLINPEVFYEEYQHATNLYHYAAYLSEQNLFDQAEVGIKRAIYFYRKLSDRAIFAFLKTVYELDLANAMQCCACYLEGQGKLKQALLESQTAIYKYEQWRNSADSAIEEDYIETLHYHEYLLGRNGYASKALIYSQKVLQLAKAQLNNKPSWSCRRRWVRCQNNYINNLADSGEVELSLELWKEQITLCEKYQENDAWHFEPLLVLAYVNYAISLSEQSDTEKAIAYVKKALALYGQVYNGEDYYYDKTKAWLLSNYGLFLTNLGNMNKGLKHLKAALDIRTKLAKIKPEWFDKNLAYSANSYASALMQTGDFVEALSHKKQSLALYKKHRKQAPRYFETMILYRRFDIVELNWLLGKRQKPFEEININALEIEESDQQQLCFIQSWLLVCVTKEESLQQHHAMHALNYYLLMRQDLQGYNFEQFVLLMVLVKQKKWAVTQQTKATKSWRADYKKFVQQRNAHTPQWMIEAAIKLGIQLPKIK